MLQGLHGEPLHAAHTIVGLAINIKIDFRQIFSYVLERHVMLQGLHGERAPTCCPHRFWPGDKHKNRLETNI